MVACEARRQVSENSGRASPENKFFGGQASSYSAKVKETPAGKRSERSETWR
jgi:hypothetical protein